MKEFFLSFSTREIALLIWTLLFIIVISINKKVRRAMVKTVEIFFSRSILTMVGALLVYVGAIVLFFHCIKLWNISLLKDTIVWTVAVPFVLLFKSTDAKDNKFFLSILKESLKWTIIVEFMINFYTLPLLLELILIPITTIIAVTQAFAETKSEHEKVSKFLKGCLSIVGWGLILYVVIMTCIHFKDLITLNTLESFLLPPIFTILVIPFIYLVAILLIYEVLFKKINFLFKKNNKMQKGLKRSIVLVARINISKVHKISKGFNYWQAEQSTSKRDYIKSLIK